MGMLMAMTQMEQKKAKTVPNEKPVKEPKVSAEEEPKVRKGGRRKTTK